MVFIVGVTYDIASTLTLKSKEELPCVCVFLISHILLLLSLPLYNISLKIAILWKLQIGKLQFFENSLKIAIRWNSIATFNIILSGDIEQNPGPSLPKPKFPRCDKTVRCNQKRLICQLCLDVVHANCVNLKHHVRNSLDAESWTCNDCLFHVLPFQNYDDIIDETPAVNVSPKNKNTHHMESLKHHHRHVSI